PVARSRLSISTRVTAPVPADMLALLAALRSDTQAQRK
ncbi:MAG TPA: hypothetical protein PKA36_05220, partial [Pseudoxanthomonas mexicana]|nr:hypothetical protein [Pseudoxanthomonas mexicana]